MANYKSIVKNFVEGGHFAGPDQPPVTTNIDERRKRMMQALDIRKNECQLRLKIFSAILIAIVLVFIYVALFQPSGLETIKKITGLVGGGSIIALFTYLLSLRDEITRIRQTLVLAAAIDESALDSMLIALSAGK